MTRRDESGLEHSNHVPTTSGSDPVDASRASRIACLSRFIASSTRSSLSKLNAALTYNVFLPLGRKTVPGSANTPRSSAFVRMMVSESSSPCAFGLLEFNLNLQRPHDRPLCQPSLLTGPFGDSPKKHPSFWRCHSARPDRWVRIARSKTSRFIR